MNLPRDEFDLIEAVRKEFPPGTLRVVRGIGDDTAVLSCSNDVEQLVTVDMLMEGVHFTFEELRPEDIGRKALAVNLSDIAAMAGRPTSAVISVALPRKGGEQLAERLHAGVVELAKKYDVALVGGDTNVWDGPLVISVTLLGEVAPGKAVLRSGAKPGDLVFVTGKLGGSLAGDHFQFRPRVHEAQQLAAFANLHAMIDLSDGLASDVRHIARESEVGVLIFADQIPISEAARNCGDGRSPLQHALSDGEDFELLFTIDPTDEERLLSGNPAGVRLTHIGVITKSRDLLLNQADGSLVPLEQTGYRHGWVN